MIIRAMSFVMVFMTALFLPLWVFIVACFAYAFIYSPYEILIIGLLVDAQFGGEIQGAGYWYTLSSAVVGAAVFLLKPLFRFSEQT